MGSVPGSESVSALAGMAAGDTKELVAKRLDELNRESKVLDQRIQELESLLNQQELTDSEFDLLRDMLAGFKDGLADMSIEQQRAALRKQQKQLEQHANLFFRRL